MVMFIYSEVDFRANCDTRAKFKFTSKRPNSLSDKENLNEILMTCYKMKRTLEKTYTFVVFLSDTGTDLFVLHS